MLILKITHYESGYLWVNKNAVYLVQFYAGKLMEEIFLRIFWNDSASFIFPLSSS